MKETLIERMRSVVFDAMRSIGTADSIDPGVWNDKFTPERVPREYLHAMCPWNVMVLILELEKLQREIDNTQVRINAELAQTQAVIMDIQEMLDTFDEGPSGRHDVSKLKPRDVRVRINALLDRVKP
jgi:hypothetical protein